MEATLDTNEVREWKRYEAFEKTRVDWIDQHPSDWQGIPIKRWVETPVTDGPHETPEIVTDGIDFVSAEAMKDGKIDFNYRRGYITRELHEVYCRKLRPKRDDIFMCKSGATTGKIAMVDTDREFNVWSPLALIRVDLNRMNPRYMFWALQSDYVQNQVRRTWSEGTQPNISMASMERLYVVAPKIVPEQRAIAAFLDRETARIDALIGHKERLIALLEEKRQAVISHAVTRGLDPNAKMKDSRVAYIGQIPEAWDALAIKHIVVTPVTDGPHETPEFIGDGIPFVSAEAVSSGQINFEKIRGFISQADHEVYCRKYKPKLGDVYMVKSGASTGTTAIVEDDREFNIWSPLAAIRCAEKANPRFILNFFRSDNFQEAVELNWSYGTQQNIGMGVIENLHVTLPPRAEQDSIIDFINEATSEIDNLELGISKGIILLKEYRTALISAAVTGQIDVREEVSAQNG